MKNTSIKLNKILDDKIHGSSELATMLNEYLFSIRNNRAQIKDSIKLVRKSWDILKSSIHI